MAVRRALRGLCVGAVSLGLVAPVLPVAAQSNGTSTAPKQTSKQAQAPKKAQQTKAQQKKTQQAKKKTQQAKKKSQQTKKVARTPRNPNDRMSAGSKLGLQSAMTEASLKSSSVLVVDQISGEVLFEKNPDSVLPIASITKLMTALVVAEADLAHV